MQKDLPQTIYLKDYTVPAFLISDVDLDFMLDAQQTQVTACFKVQHNSASTQTQLSLFGEHLLLHSVSVDGVALLADDYQQTATTLVIDNLPLDRPFNLTIINSIYPNKNTALEGLYLSKGMLCTQCEAEGFRKITYFLDRPDVMSRYTTTMTADKTLYPILLSNGNKLASGDLENNRHWVRWQDPFAKPCYLFALVAGQLAVADDNFVTCSGRNIALQIFVEAHDLDKTHHAMQSLKKAIAWDEQVYGREYDLDLYMIVAVSHFNMGAMENKGLNIFNTKFVLARPDTATDSDYEQIEAVIAHEYFHNWSGNRVTCRDWFQLSLKEGFTVFRDQEFTADQISRGVKRIEDVNMLRTRQFAEDASPMAHPIRPDSYMEINNFYTLTVYEKGAEVVRMLHTLLGANGFRKGCDLYFARHDGQAVTCDDFVQAMEEANQVDLTQFRHWYSQAGTPILNIDHCYDATSQTLIITLSQNNPPTVTQPEKLPLHIPVKIALFNPQGEEMLSVLDHAVSAKTEHILELTQAQQAFVYNQVAQPPVISALRGFSAPVKVTQMQSLEELAFLLSYDTDPFNRWDAGQKLATQIIFGLMDDLQQGKTLLLNPILIHAFQKIVAQSWEDLAYFSLLLDLPSETYLAEQMAIIDVHAIHQAREFVRLQLAWHLENSLLDLYQRYHETAGNLDALAMGRRRVKNRCLSYLGLLKTAPIEQLILQQFTHAPNMTDQSHALAVMVYNAHPQKQTCLDAFYQQWQNEALVIDKWFILQASSPAADTLIQVQNLMRHPAFDLKNPNRARSLIGAFTQNNPIHFHAVNGQGYEFLGEQILALNGLNPQIAARLLTPLISWKRFNAHHQQLMQAQLQKIIQQPEIANEVYEVASKSLA